MLCCIKVHPTLKGNCMDVRDKGAHPTLIGIASVLCWYTRRSYVKDAYSR